MSSFHTKTIRRILEPVALQVSKLILNIEEDECPNQFKDLDIRVNMVKCAVENLVKVGRETISQSDDKVFSEEMPNCLTKVNEASDELLRAVKFLQADNKSTAGRKSLISGSRGILKGTFEVLNCFDMSEVRKIVGYCESVQLVLSTVEHVETMTDLKEIIRNLTPCMSQMISNVTGRLDELVIPYHVEILSRSVDEIKQLTPILISALKLYISSKDNYEQGNYEIRANRDFLITQMTDDIQEIIRALRLNSLENEELITFKTAKSILDSSIKTIKDILINSKGEERTGFEPTFRQTILAMKKIAQFTLETKLRDQLEERIKDFDEVFVNLANLKYKNCPESLLKKDMHEYSRKGLEILEDLEDLCQESIGFHDSSSANFYKTARTFEGKFNQAQKWILNPTGPYRNVGYEACRVLTNDSKRLMCRVDVMNNNRRNSSDLGQDCEWIDACFESCEHLDRSAVRLDQLLKQPQNPETIKLETDLSLAMSKSLISVWKRLQEGLVHEVADWYTDVLGPLRQFSDVAFSSYQNGESNTLEEEFFEKSDLLSTHSERICCIAEVASSNLNDYLKADSLRTLSFYLPELTNQVLLSGKILFKLGKNLVDNHEKERKGEFSVAEQHFTMMKDHWILNVEKMQSLVDEAMDAWSFIKAQEKKITTDSSSAEVHLKNHDQHGIVESTTSIARRANRILQIGKKEADNSEDVEYSDRVKTSLLVLHSSIKPMVMHVKQMICNPNDIQYESQWRKSNQDLIKAVTSLKGSITPSYTKDYDQSTLNSSKHDGHIIYPVQEMKDVMLNDNETSRLSDLNHNLRRMMTYDPGLITSTQTLTNEHPTLGMKYSPRNSISSSSYLSRIDFPDTEDNHLLQMNPFYNSYNFSSCFSVDDLSQTQNGLLTIRNGDGSTRPQTPDTEFDEEFNFPSPTENQPIMAAAYALNHEARLWSSKDNEIVASVRKMAHLMAKLSLIMRGEYGTKKELINISMAIADASLEVYKCSKKLASQCTDRRMIANLEQLGDRILMISNQLKIIATVKATMLGTIGSVEDQQNTEVLVGNAQNLMQTVIETLHAAEGASLRLKGDKFKIKWHPRIQSYKSFLD